MSEPNARLAPGDGRRSVADLAEKHADELEQRVAELRRLSKQLRG